MFEYLYSFFYTEEENDEAKDPRWIHQKYLVTKAIDNNTIKLSPVRNNRVDTPVIKKGLFVKSYKKRKRKMKPVDIL